MENNKKIVDLLSKAISVTRGRISEREVFRDFIDFCALQISTMTDPIHSERAGTLQKLLERYETKEKKEFTNAFQELVHIFAENVKSEFFGICLAPSIWTAAQTAVYSSRISLH